ncbi:MAG: segregation/condensation protein A [Lachnospiraceae bacterium]|jgi:segregation and condensation protein A|nr:segregation/condensation protein A [Lachnospiraceae bacterium]
MAIPVKLEAFEGPLDLLMHLITINKVDIYDIPISTITDQYLAYIDRMDREDMNVTSEFLVMAATLLDIKCRMLLPREVDEEGEEIDPRAELVEKLLAYKMVRYMSAELREKQEDARGSFYRTKEDLPEEVLEYEPPVDYEKLIGDNTLLTLHTIFQDIMKRRENKVDPIRSRFGTIEKEEIDMDVKTGYVRKYLIGHGRTSFRKLLERQKSREEVIVTFLVILEMMKSGDISLKQEETFGEITIEVRDPEHLEEELDSGEKEQWN